jgi:hypothetical protein
MTIQTNDYIEGTEHYGHATRKTKGWVDAITGPNSDGGICYDIQADDEWQGSRGTTLFTALGEVVRLPDKERIITQFHKK